MKSQWLFAAGMGLLTAGVFCISQALTQEFARARSN